MSAARREHAAAAARPLIRLAIQGIFAYVDTLHSEAGSTAGSLEPRPVGSGGSERLAATLLPEQLQALRNCKKILIAMEVC